MDDNEQQFPAGYRGVLPISTIGRGAIDFRDFPDARRLRDLSPEQRTRLLDLNSPSLIQLMRDEVEADRRLQERRKVPKKPPRDELRQPREVVSDQPTDWRDPTGLYWKLQL